MSCCGGGARGNGTFPKRHSGGCNCSKGQRHEEETEGCFKQGTSNCQSRKHRETAAPRVSTGGCGRPGCPLTVHPPPEVPEVEWEYTNYNRNIHRWPATYVENSYEDNELEEKQDCQSDNYEEFEGAENIQQSCCYHNESNEGCGYQQLHERFGGGCDNFQENQQSYLDYYDEEEPVDHQQSSSQGCTRCSEFKSTCDSSENRDKRRVHF